MKKHSTIKQNEPYICQVATCGDVITVEDNALMTSVIIIYSRDCELVFLISWKSESARDKLCFSLRFGYTGLIRMIMPNNTNINS